MQKSIYSIFTFNDHIVMTVTDVYLAKNRVNVKLSEPIAE